MHPGRWDGLRRRARGAAVPALVLGAVLLPFAPALLSPSRTLLARDTERLYAPVRTLVVSALSELRLPLWNPFEGFGMPLFAQGIHGVLHPVSLLGAALAPGSMDLLLALHLASAALGAWILARTLVSDAGAAAVGAIGYALSGYVVSMTGNLVFLAGAGALPWAVAGLLAAAAGDRHGLVAGAAGVAACALSGDMHELAAGLAIAAVLSVERSGMRGAVAAALAGILGLGLAGVQLVPSWANLPHTLRSAHVPAEALSDWALLPSRLPELLLPGLFFHSGEGSAPVFVALSGTDRNLPFAEGICVGGPVLVLAVLGASSGRRGRTLAFLAAGLLAVALGPRVGLVRALAALPAIGGFQFPEKLLGPFSLTVAMLAALGVERARERPSWLAAAAAWTLAPLAAVLAAGLAAPDALERRFVAWSASIPSGERARALLEGGGRELAATLARRHLVEGALVAAGGLALLAAAAFLARRRPRALAAGCAAAAWAAAAPAALFAVHFGDLRAHRGVPPAPALLRARPATRVAVFPTVDCAAPPDVALDRDDQATFCEHRALQGSRAVEARVESVDYYTGLQPRRAANVARRLGDARWQIYRRMALGLVLVPADGGAPQPRAAAMARGGTLLDHDPLTGLSAFAVPHRDWASFVAAAVAAPGPREALTELARRDAAGDPTVVVEATEAPATAPGRVLSFSRGAEWLRIEAEADSPALLVVGDSWWPGWTARLDGAPLDILAADVLARGVRFPPGRHALEMRYEPPALRYGALVSAAALLALACATWLGARAGARATPATLPAPPPSAT